MDVTEIQHKKADMGKRKRGQIRHKFKLFFQSVENFNTSVT